MTDSLHKHEHINASKAAFKIKGLSISYGKRKIIDNVNIEIKQNSFVSIMGINGCGKTTILKAVMNLVKSEGEINLLGQPMNKIKKNDIAKKVAYVPQLFNANSEVTVYDYISFSRFPYSGSFTLSKEDKKIIADVIEKLGIESIARSFITEISGGQRQKVAIAAALAQETDVIILDEPTTYLDIRNQYEILEIMNSLHLRGKTIITVLHDLPQALKYADEVILIHNKKVFAQGNPHKVLTKKNIKEVYGVDAIMKKVHGVDHIVDVDTKKIAGEIK